MNQVLPSRARAAALVLVVTMLVSSCSTSGDDSGDDGEPTPTQPLSSTPAAAESSGADGGSESPDSAGGPTEGPYLPVPAGVDLTPQGTLLAVGKPATVAFKPSEQRVGALSLRVDRLQRTTFAESFQGWKLDAATRRTTPYFVTVTVRNVGRTRLGGTPVPLFVLDDKNTLIPPTTFAGDFEPCPSRSLPAGFVTGERASVCLAYLVAKGRSLAGVTFRPNRGFEAITWTGDVDQPGPQRRPGQQNGSGRQNGQNGSGQQDS